jgi:MGT family glycosyltransferase
MQLAIRHGDSHQIPCNAKLCPAVANILVATVPLTGHVQPMLLLVTELVTRGHRVVWCGASKFRSAIESTGAFYASMKHATDWDDANIGAAFPGIEKQRGLARVKAQLIHMFIAPMEKQLADLLALAAENSSDVVLADSAHMGASLLSEIHRLPWVTLGISALVVPSIDTAPFGPGWRPSSSRIGRLRNRFLHWLVFRCMFRTVNKAYRLERKRVGLATSGTYFDCLTPHLYLQPTVPEFEYPRLDLPPQIIFVGPLVPPPSQKQSQLPSWWSDVEDAHRRQIPIVLVTQGTMATRPSELIIPALHGLSDHNALVIVTTPNALAASDVPANARVATFIPYHLAMPLLSLVVTNGGYGGVQMALRFGVPLVVAGGSEEKPEIAARVAWCGAGVDLRTGKPSARKVKAAVKRVLATPSFASKAREMSQHMQRRNAATESALLIEQLLLKNHNVRTSDDCHE